MVKIIFNFNSIKFLWFFLSIELTESFLSRSKSSFRKKHIFIPSIIKFEIKGNSLGWIPIGIDENNDLNISNLSLEKRNSRNLNEVNFISGALSCSRNNATIEPDIIYEADDDYEIIAKDEEEAMVTVETLSTVMNTSLTTALAQHKSARKTKRTTEMSISATVDPLAKTTTSPDGRRSTSNKNRLTKSDRTTENVLRKTRVTTYKRSTTMPTKSVLDPYGCNRKKIESCEDEVEFIGFSINKTIPSIITPPNPLPPLNLNFEIEKTTKYASKKLTKSSTALTKPSTSLTKSSTTFTKPTKSKTAHIQTSTDKYTKKTMPTKAYEKGTCIDKHHNIQTTASTLPMISKTTKKKNACKTTKKNVIACKITTRKITTYKTAKIKTQTTKYYCMDEVTVPMDVKAENLLEKTTTTENEIENTEGTAESMTVETTQMKTTRMNAKMKFKTKLTKEKQIIFNKFFKYHKSTTTESGQTTTDETTKEDDSDETVRTTTTTEAQHTRKFKSTKKSTSVGPKRLHNFFFSNNKLNDNSVIIPSGTMIYESEGQEENCKEDNGKELVKLFITKDRNSPEENKLNKQSISQNENSKDSPKSEIVIRIPSSLKDFPVILIKDPKVPTLTMSVMTAGKNTSLIDTECNDLKLSENILNYNDLRNHLENYDEAAAYDTYINKRNYVLMDSYNDSIISNILTLNPYDIIPFIPQYIATTSDRKPLNFKNKRKRNAHLRQFSYVKSANIYR